jgi:hypothetical protein
MPWLNHFDDEVTCFHPQFCLAADSVLNTLGLNGRYHWLHHPHTIGVQVTPDFVLVETSTNRWVFVVEIKRTRASVFSQRNQVQAKGYSEANRLLYTPGRPLFFCVTNLEVTLLFALNGNNPPQDCRVAGMAFDSGSFLPGTATQHRAAFERDFQSLVHSVITTTTVVYDSVWPKLVRQMLSHAGASPYNALISTASPAPAVVFDYFVGSASDIDKRQLFLRCLVAEYLKGLLLRFRHAGAATIPTLRASLGHAANQILALRNIDFSGVFEPHSDAIYRNLLTVPNCTAAVEQYLDQLVTERVNFHALSRGDALEFPETLMTELYPLQVQDRRGKAQTDPDLAFLLAALTIDDPGCKVLDPCSGDGNLLAAAYEVLRAMGGPHAVIMDCLRGIEVDPLAAKIAALRLIVNAPSVLAPTDPNRIVCDDMFSSALTFSDADVVVMNPPFKRYEAQDDAPIPPALREHYRGQIAALGRDVETESGQSNIYNMYVEYAVKASQLDTVFGFVLDNRWHHKRDCEGLRAFLLRECLVLAIIEYPHDAYFKDWSIATSLLIAKKGVPNGAHGVQFIRTNDPRRADFLHVASALRGGCPFPADWHVNVVPQAVLGTASWKSHFSRTLTNEFRDPQWPNLESLFTACRRGSLEKEGGGVELFEFPFDRTDYGPKRLARPAPRLRFQTNRGAALTTVENDALRHAASVISPNFRGYALRKAERIQAYNLSVTDVTIDQIIEAPLQRTPAVQRGYFSLTRRAWDASINASLAQINADPTTSPYVGLVSTAVGLNNTVLPDVELWNVLREPYAGELIIPRKLRVGHRVHINRFAYNQNGRQVRLSSNFLSYGDCTAVDPSTGLQRSDAVDLIAAFLLSSFGQLQFELEAHNREGARSIEQYQVAKIRIFDPRWIRPVMRAQILNAASQLPYPVPTDVPAYAQPALSALDLLIADEICHMNPALSITSLLQEVHQMLFDCIETRRP